MVRLPPFNPYIAIFIGVVSISIPSILIKLATGAPAAMIAFYSLLLTVIFMLPFTFSNYRHEFKLMNKKNWIISVIAGVFLAFYFVFWFESLSYTSVASAVILLALQPVFVFIGSSLLSKERFSQAAVISIFIILLGIAIIGFGDYQRSGSVFFGDWLALLGVIMITVYFVTVQNIRKKLSFIPFTFITYTVSMIVLLIYNLVLQQPFTGYVAHHWWIFIILAIVPPFLGHLLFNWAIKWVSTATVSIAKIFAPLSAVLLAYLILDEIVSSAQWLGGSIIIFGLFLFIMGTRRKRKVTISKKNGHNP